MDCLFRLQGGAIGEGPLMLGTRHVTLILLLLPATSVLGQSDTAAPFVQGDVPPAPEEIPAPVQSVSEGAIPDVKVSGPFEITGIGATAPSCRDSLDAFWGYRYNENVFGWMIGNGDQFGDVMLISNRFEAAGIATGVGAGVEFHSLAGPGGTDMPPMVYEFSLGYQMRDQLGDLRYDVSCGILAASDFEGSARRGIRLPSHAVGYVALNETLDVVFGFEYLDRADISVLPVGGLIWRPDRDVRLELVFPRPSAYVQLTQCYRLCLKGGLGGATWAVERDSEVDDLATYSDLRFSLGVEKRTEEGRWESLEVAYLFDRTLDFTSGDGDYRPNGTIMIRSVTSY